MSQLHCAECCVSHSQAPHGQAAGHAHLIAGVHPASQAPLGRGLARSARQLGLSWIPHSRDDGAPAALKSAQAETDELSTSSGHTSHRHNAVPAGKQPHTAC